MPTLLSAFLRLQQYIHIFVHTHIYLFIHSVTHSFIYLFIYSFIHPFIYLYIHSFIHPSIHSSIHSFTHSFIHPFIHSFIHSLLPGTPGWPFFMPRQAATATPQSPALSFISIPRQLRSFFITCNTYVRSILLFLLLLFFYCL
jgi:hypothetical protein